jgi:hypothetical protein
VADIILAGHHPREAITETLQFMRFLAADEAIAIDPVVARSETETGFRNLALPTTCGYTVISHTRRRWLAGSIFISAPSRDPCNCAWGGSAVCLVARPECPRQFPARHPRARTPSQRAPVGPFSDLGPEAGLQTRCDIQISVYCLERWRSLASRASSEANCGPIVARHTLGRHDFVMRSLCERSARDQACSS